MSRRADPLAQAVAWYSTASAEDKRAFYLAAKAVDQALGLGMLGQSLPKRRGRPVGSKNKPVEAQGVGQ